MYNRRRRRGKEVVVYLWRSGTAGLLRVWGRAQRRRWRAADPIFIPLAIPPLLGLNFFFPFFFLSSANCDISIAAQLHKFARGKLGGRKIYPSGTRAMHHKRQQEAPQLDLFS